MIAPALSLSIIITNAYNKNQQKSSLPKLLCLQNPIGGIKPKAQFFHSEHFLNPRAPLPQVAGDQAGEQHIVQPQRDKADGVECGIQKGR